eukprot:Skav231088  [mRNA]  locus=scaffold524:480640:483498:- [translate_table: standard]
MELFNLFSEAFRNLPLAHLVDNKVLVLHGGLPGEGPDPRIWMPGQTPGPQGASSSKRYAQSIGPTTSEKEARPGAEPREPSPGWACDGYAINDEAPQSGY